MPVVNSPTVTADLDEIVSRPLPWDRLAGSTVLVTGASGMLPSYTVYSLLELNDRHGTGIAVKGLVRNEAKARHILADVVGRSDFELIVQDVAEPLTGLDRLDYVVHGASAARPALLDACVARQSKGFVLMSSSEVYGAQPAGTELIEEGSYGGLDTLNPRACYSEGKRAAETLCAVYRAQYGLPCHIARFGHVYGPGMALDDGRVQADFAANVVNGADIVLNSDGSAMRTYTYVADAIAGLFYVLLAGTDLAYNVADERGLVSIRELAVLFTNSRPDKGLQLVFRNAEDERAYSPAKGLGLSNRRLAGLGWQPLVDLPAGLDRMVTELERTAHSNSS